MSKKGPCLHALTAHFDVWVYLGSLHRRDALFCLRLRSEAREEKRKKVDKQKRYSKHTGGVFCEKKDV